MRKLLPIPIGTKIQTTMGIRETGTVIEPFYGPFTDGSYRQPTEDEIVVYCEWEDKTKGWVHLQFVKII